MSKNTTYLENDYENLTPHLILNAIEDSGFACDGRLFELNSYENRVFQIGIEDETPVIAKFYRPNRWTDDQILEEHSFTLELEADEVPVIAPIVHLEKSLFEFEGYRFALYKRQGGYAPELSNASHLESIGRSLARIHAKGGVKPYKARGHYDFDAMGINSAQILLNDFVPPHYYDSYQQVTNAIDGIVKTIQPAIQALPYMRTHGDCHLGNILWQEPKPFFVDFDDSLNAPQIADIWMLLDGEHDQRHWQLKHFLDGYAYFADFNPGDLKYAEIFRTLRMINYSAWIATRWNDPAFQRAFDWFDTESFWRSHINDLELQQAKLLQEFE